MNKYSNIIVQQHYVERFSNAYVKNVRSSRIIDSVLICRCFTILLCFYIFFHEQHISYRYLLNAPIISQYKNTIRNLLDAIIYWSKSSGQNHINQQEKHTYIK